MQVRLAPLPERCASSSTRPAPGTRQLIGELVATGAVDSVDFKGYYSGSIVDQPADPVLYRRVAEAFPEAWIEDPALTEETDAVLAATASASPGTRRSTRSRTSEALPYPPRMVNIKPSRLGGLRSLLDAYAYCEEHGIGNYGGGQFELGVGRGQNQYLASMFHADAPNDVAPTGYNLPGSPGGAARAARWRRRPPRWDFAGAEKRAPANSATWPPPLGCSLQVQLRRSFLAGALLAPMLCVGSAPALGLAADPAAPRARRRRRTKAGGSAPSPAAPKRAAVKVSLHVTTVRITRVSLHAQHEAAPRTRGRSPCAAPCWSKAWA